MPGGQSITSGQGTVTRENPEFALAGAESSLASGTSVGGFFCRLRSRQPGIGAAERLLVGVSATLSTGTMLYGEGVTLSGSFTTGSTGILLVRGRTTITWNANSEPDLAGYKVYHGTASQVYTEVRDVGNVTSYVWDGLLLGMTHYFAVTAYDTSNNESTFSAEVSKVF